MIRSTNNMKIITIRDIYITSTVILFIFLILIVVGIFILGSITFIVLMNGIHNILVIVISRTASVVVIITIKSILLADASVERDIVVDIVAVTKVVNSESSSSTSNSRCSSRIPCIYTNVLINQHIHNRMQLLTSY